MTSLFRRGAMAAAVAIAAATGACDSGPAQGTGAASAAQKQQRATAVFAGGCFWCTEADFEKLPGVVSAVSGYTGGSVDRPTYEQVTAGGTGHYEAVRVTYDPARIGYDALVRHFFRTIDPLDDGGQFCDRGSSYRSAIFVAGARERQAAETEKKRASRTLGQGVVTPVLPAARFWPAEDYHQDYYKRNPVRYRFYRYRCGRDARLAELWDR